RPAGADRARVDVQLDGVTAWVLGDAVSAPAAPALPAAAASEPERITGIRVVFDNADGRPFSATVPAADWAATVTYTVTLPASAADTGITILFSTGTRASTCARRSMREA